jgi:hypothetical protein
MIASEFKLKDQRLIIVDKEGAGRYNLQDRNLLNLGDYSTAAKGLFLVLGGMNRGELYQNCSGLDYNLIDFAIPFGHEAYGDPEKQGIWYYGDSSYHKASNMGHFIPDSYVYRKIAIYAMLHKKHNTWENVAY